MRLKCLRLEQRRFHKLFELSVSGFDSKHNDLLTSFPLYLNTSEFCRILSKETLKDLTLNMKVPIVIEKRIKKEKSAHLNKLSCG